MIVSLSRQVGYLLVAVLCLLLVSGCSADTLSPPERAVDSLLRLRAERSTDASAYAELLQDPAIAAELAAAAAEEPAESRPLPEWEEPYISAESSAGADVVVVWRNAEEWPEWPVATRFVTQEVDGEWVTVDAEPLQEASIPPPAR